jgi:hypothetical protein
LKAEGGSHRALHGIDPVVRVRTGAAIPPGS